MKPNLESWTPVEDILLQISVQFYFQTNVYFLRSFFEGAPIQDF